MDDKKGISPYMGGYNPERRQIPDSQQIYYLDEYDRSYATEALVQSSQSGRSSPRVTGTRELGFEPIPPPGPPPSYDSLLSIPRAPTSPSYGQSSRLQKPIAIPAADKEMGSPFLRAYAPVLENYHLQRHQFLAVLDHINRTMVGSPPLEVLSLVGNVVSFVPLATAQIVGNAVQIGAKLGNAAVAMGRTELLLREINKDIFIPRGLKLELAKLDALARIANIPILNNEGGIDKNRPLLTQIEDMDQMFNVSSTERRMKFLEPYIAELDLSSVPPPEKPTNIMSQWSAKVSEKRRAKGEEKQIEKRAKAHEDWSKDSMEARRDYEKDMRKLAKEEEKARRERKPEKMAKELQKVESERRKIEREYEKEMRKVDKDRMKDDREEQSLRKGKWLIIRNLDEDSGPGPNPDLA